MTSSSLKRPLNFLELVNPHLGGASLTMNQQQCGVSTDYMNSKRRCTNFGQPQPQQETTLLPPTFSAFRNPEQVLGPLSDDVASMIRGELSKAGHSLAHQSNSSTINNTNNPINDTNTALGTPMLTIRQTQLICEKLIRDREQKLREEYDKILMALQQVHQATQQQPVASVTSSTIPSGPVLLASNLDEQLATPEALFTLFGVFGDVIRVKILFNKKDNALVQMADANQAQVAQGFLDKQKVFGKLMRVTRSKHQLVQMPREGNQSDAGLTKDFTNSPLHRFKIPGSRNYQNIYPPSYTLHISNIPATADENDIPKAFKDTCGFDCSSFKFFLKNKKMALMKFDTIEQATIALIKMHNFQINEDTNLRVSFSKSVN